MASLAPITELDDLRAHLQIAIELEASTLPPYLCALYSIDRARNETAAQVLESIAMEEMLHLALAANVLNAIGGAPALDATRLMPGYPTSMPHSDRSFEISLVPFSREAIELFLQIEKPSPRGAPPESDRYETIGQFYEAIRIGLVTLSGSLGEATLFSGDPKHQVTRTLDYGGSGSVIVVENLNTALLALDEIVEQGEGAEHHEIWDGDRQMFHPDRAEVGHYYRLLELKLGRFFRPGDTPNSGPTGETAEVDWDGALPMGRNPRLADQPAGSEIRVAQEAFNTTYSQLLGHLESAFNGNPISLVAAIAEMFSIKAQAQHLMRMPTGNGSETAGPTFEYVAPAAR